MKKLLTVLACLLCLSACASQKEEVVDDTDTQEVVEEESLTIVSPLGAPVLAFYDQIENENYTRVQASAISALWTGEESPDVMVCDITSGIKAINNGADYKLAAVITFGNLYLASTGNDDNGTMDPGDRIVLFGTEAMLPYKVFHYLYGEEYDANIFYENSATEAARALMKGVDSENEEVDYVFLAQPAMYLAMQNNENAAEYVDIQEVYQEKANANFVQAAVFIKNTVDNEQANEFLSNLETSIQAGIKNPELIEEGLSVYEGDEAAAQYGFNPTIVLQVFQEKNALGMNAMGLGYKKAIDIKEDIDAMMATFGETETSEEIYFE